MGRYLQALKNEVRNTLPAVVRKDEPRAPPPPVQPYYDDVQPPYQPGPNQSYGQPPANIDPAVLQALLQGAKAQGAYEALQSSNDASANRMQALALAAINKENKPFEIRYRGNAHDKFQQRLAELKFWSKVLLSILAVAFIAWLYWNMPQSAGFGYAHAPSSGNYRHIKRTEEYDQ